MKLITTISIFLIYTLVFGSVELLRNPDFKLDLQTGLPKGWRMSKGAIGERVKISENKFALQLTGAPPKKRSWWIQHLPNIKMGQSYIFKVKLKGAIGVKAFAYLECNKPWKTFSSSKITCNGKWQEAEIKFKFDKIINSPYLVFCLLGKGQVAFMEPSLTKSAPLPTEYSFSNDFSNWKLKNARIINSDGSHEKVLQLSATGPGASAVSEKLQLESGKNYLLTYQVKGGSNTKLTDSQGATWFRVMPIEGGVPIVDTGDWLDAFNSWQTKRLIFKIPASKQPFVVINLKCELKGGGSATFDNINLKKSKNNVLALKILLDLPFSYRNSCYPRYEKSNEISGLIISGIPDVNRLQIDFAGKQQNLIPKKAETKFSIPLPGAPGHYPIVVRALDVAGRQLAIKSTVFTVQKPAVQEVTFNKNRIMLVNGKPFFPLGTWSVHGPKSLDEKMKIMSENGFNIAICGSDELDILAANKLMGLVKVVNKIPVFSSVKQKGKWLDFYTKAMHKVMIAPALAGYFIIDEPAWRGVPVSPLVEAYSLVRSIDPYHPIMLNGAPRGKINSLRDYVRACDIYGVDIYPVPAPNSHSDLRDKMITSVGGYTDKCRKVVWNRKPIWMTLQGFSWDTIKKKNKPYRYPTHNENRFMAYDAIVHGATGIFWWGINRGNENWEFVRNLGLTVKELQALSAVLVEPTVKPSGLKSNFPELVIMHKVHNNKNYYIVVNESKRSFTASFIGTIPTSLKVLFEKRRIFRKNNVLTDRFSPYDVHVYTDAEELPLPLQCPIVSYKQTNTLKFTDDFKTANWIWYPGQNKIPGSQAFFIRDFKIDPKISQAKLFVTADDRFRCYINGKLLVEHNHNGRGFSTVSVIDIVKEIKPGINRIAIQAADAGKAPCGLLFALRLTGADGKITRIISDKQVYTSEKAFKNWLDERPHLNKNWVCAEIIGKYGSPPWGFQSVAKPADSSLLGEFDF